MSPRDLRKKQNDFGNELALKGWYHSFELPDGSVIEGTMPLSWERKRWSRFPLPEELTGRRLLDIGSWDGWFSFEAERRGATVTSVDCVEAPNYRRMHRALGSRADYRVLDLYELPAAGLAPHDYVLCLGVLYHLKHPVLGLEIVCSLVSEVAVIDTYVIDGGNWQEHADDIPVMEFYETDELNGNLDNWTGPTVGCVLAMCRAAGFARVELLAVDPDYALVACHRKFPRPPETPERAAPKLISVFNTVTSGINFSLTHDEYVTCVFECDGGEIRREDVCVEIGQFGAPAVLVKRDSDGLWHANVRVPPGTPAGWQPLRVRLSDSGFGAVERIAVGVELRAEHLKLRGIFDGLTWEEGAASEYVSCWLAGLPENADRHNTRLWIEDLPLETVYLGVEAGGFRQVNAKIPADYPRREFQVIALCGGVDSNSLPLRLI